MYAQDQSTSQDLWNGLPAAVAAARQLFESVPVAALDLSVSSAGEGCEGGFIRIVDANHAARVLFGVAAPEELAHYVESQMSQVAFRLSVESALKPPMQTRMCFGLCMLGSGGRELLLKITSMCVGTGDDGSSRVLMFLEDTAPAHSLRVNLEVYRKCLSQLVEARNREFQTAKEVLVNRDRLAEMLVEVRSAHTAAHMKRVAVLSEHIGQRLDIRGLELAQLVSAARLHDIGILHVPMEILARTGPISVAERAVVQEHPLHARDILSAAGYSEQVLTAVSQHHERYDGTGYPEGLMGEQICPAARVLAVADVLDAMVAPRSYRPSLGLSDALANLERQASRFDPVVIAACRDVCASSNQLLPEMGDYERAAMTALSPLPAIGAECG